MEIILYNINSFGGNYEYVKQLYKGYSTNNLVSRCRLVTPLNSDFHEPHVVKLLLPDLITTNNKLVRRIYYLYRSTVNPLRFFRFLRKEPSSVVLFNDFDQLTALIWFPFFWLLKHRHTFGVYLHDPDRDKFFAIKAISVFTMKCVMSFMNFALHHGYLPQRKYYKANLLTIRVPHGIYGNSLVDKELLDKILKDADGSPIIGVLGNIRDEKNYEFIIDAIEKLKKVKLLIAGSPANSHVSIKVYQDYAKARKVEDRVIWLIGYMPIREFNAAIQSCDIVSLCYKRTFSSQSGMLNSIAPFMKKLIITDTPSSLRQSVEDFNLGMIIPDNDMGSLISAINTLLDAPIDYNTANWENYRQYSSWDKHVSIAVESYKKILNER